jgi:hypothetical protein
MTAREVVDDIGALCFGVVIGYITYRTLIRSTEKAAISDLAAVIAAVGGGAITALFKPGTTSFAAYAVGLLAGMAAFFVLYGRLHGKAKLAKVMAAETVTLDRTAAAPQPAQAPGQAAGPLGPQG